MKNPLLFFLLLLVSGCIDRAPDRELYLDLDCRVVRVGQESHPSDDKPHEPTVTNLLLLQSLRDPTLFMEYPVNDSVYYNTRVGDRKHWAYVNRHKFFHITPR